MVFLGDTPSTRLRTGPFDVAQDRPQTPGWKPYGFPHLPLDTAGKSDNSKSLRCTALRVLTVTKKPGGTPPVDPYPSMRSWAALRVLCSSMAMVMGPTPPGTGLMAAAFSETGPKSTSPIRR